MRNIICSLIWLMTSLGCATSKYGDGILVDKDRRELAVYSSGDIRSTLEESENIEVIQRIEEGIKQHLKKNRRDIPAILALAQVQVALGKLKSAEKNCRTALRLDARNKAPRIILAQIALRRGNFDLASIFLESVGGAKSKDNVVLNMLALIELNRGNNTLAMSLFRNAAMQDSNDIAARMNLGVLLLKHRMLNQAAIEF